MIQKKKKKKLESLVCNNGSFFNYKFILVSIQTHVLCSVNNYSKQRINFDLNKLCTVE